MKNESDSEPLTIPKDLPLRIIGKREKFKVTRFDPQDGRYVCVHVSGGPEFKLGKKIVEEAFLDVLAEESTRQVRRPTGKQPFLRRDTNSDEEATYPRS